MEMKPERLYAGLESDTAVGGPIVCSLDEKYNADCKMVLGKAVVIVFVLVMCVYVCGGVVLVDGLS